MFFVGITSFFLVSLLSVAQHDCSDPFLSSDKVLLSKNYPAHQTQESIQTYYEKMLKDQERLEYRAMKSDDSTYKIPIVPTNSHGIKQPTHWVPFPEHIVTAIIHHTQWSIKQNYAQHIFFPDMGHGHFYLPQEKATTLLLTATPPVERWTALLNDPELVILYHTRENYDLSETSPDPHLTFYNQHRNLLGSMTNTKSIQILAGPGTTPNTVRLIPNMSSVGTIYFSASQKGCFPFTTKDSPPLFLDFSFQGHSVEKSNSTPSSNGGK